MRTLTSRAITTAAAAAIVLTTATFQPAAAGYRNDGDAAAAAFIFAGVLGTIAAIVASQNYDNHSHGTYGSVRGPGFGGYGPHRGPHGWQHHR